jgi:hypothetical protein
MSPASTELSPPKAPPEFNYRPEGARATGASPEQPTLLVLTRAADEDGESPEAEGHGQPAQACGTPLPSRQHHRELPLGQKASLGPTQGAAQADKLPGRAQS